MHQTNLQNWIGTKPNRLKHGYGTSNGCLDYELGCSAQFGQGLVLFAAAEIAKIIFCLARNQNLCRLCSHSQLGHTCLESLTS